MAMGAQCSARRCIGGWARWPVRGHSPGRAAFPHLLLPLLAAAAGACASLSITEERQLGEEVNRQVRREVSLIRDPVVVNYVRAIGQRLVDAAGSQPFTFRFYVAEGDQINAFALPGGYIYVNTETLLRAENVSEVAGVIGHEVGHVVERHVARNYRRAQRVGILHGVSVVTAAIVGGGAAARAADYGTGVAGAAYLNSYGRDAEREADAFAVRVLPRAGYDPDGLASFFETMIHESGGGEPPAFLSSHPATHERIRNTRGMIASTQLPDELRVHDSGKLEIIQRRIRLLRDR
jgi:predicted Zn-dependent protease